jgi:hypothetical protein
MNQSAVSVFFLSLLDIHVISLLHLIFLRFQQALIKKKDPMLHEHFMTLTALGVADVNNPFYDFLNESLLRGLSGLLNLETCQFVWDQCFVVGK